MLFAMNSNSPNDHGNHNCCKQHEHSAATDPFFKQRPAVAEEVTECRDHDRPEYRTRDVVNEERAPWHLRRTCEDRCKNPKSCYEASDQDRFVPMALEKVVDETESVRRDKEVLTEAGKEIAAVVMADGKTYVIPKHGPGGRDEHHQRQSEVATRRKEAGRKKDRFARNWKPCIFEHNAEKNYPVAVTGKKSDKCFENVHLINACRYSAIIGLP